MMTVALCVICHERPAELADALASAAADTFDEVVVLDMASSPPIPPVKGVTWLRSDENVGVARGRNRLADAVTADVLVFLDDDAVLTRPVAGLVRAAFAASPSLGAVAFKVQREDGSIASEEHPFRGPPSDVDRPRPCAYFVGCAYAARSDAVREAGGYDEEFFYSTEEVELAYRLVAAGWSLRYEPAAVAEHRPSARGRSVRPQVPALRMRNRIVMARRHLPGGVAAVHVLAWTVRTALEAARARSLRHWGSGWLDGMRVPVDRRPLGYRTLLALHRQGGRVLW